MKYFDHDTEAYKDDKIVLLRSLCGGAAVDAYWTILEAIYREETELKPNQNRIGFQSVCVFLQVSEDQLQEWIAAMVECGLLVERTCEDGGVSYVSQRALETIGKYKGRKFTNKGNGSKGGRPRKSPVQAVAKTEPKPKRNRTKTEVKPTENPSETKQEPSANQSESETAIEERREKIEPLGSDEPKGERGGRFAPPTRDEVAAYAAERGYAGFSADRFMAHYESNGWRVGRNPMESWKAAVTNWALRDRSDARGGGANVDLGSYAAPSGSVF